MNTTLPEQADRRVHTQVREVFINACHFISPVIAGNDLVVTVSNFAITHMLTDRYPALSQAEIQIIIITTQKTHNRERIRALLHIKETA